MHIVGHTARYMRDAQCMCLWCGPLSMSGHLAQHAIRQHSLWKVQTGQGTSAHPLQVMTLRLLRHRNIVQFYGACLEPDCLFIVTELLAGGLARATAQPISMVPSVEPASVGSAPTSWRHTACDVKRGSLLPLLQARWLGLGYGNRSWAVCWLLTLQKACKQADEADSNNEHGCTTCNPGARDWQRQVDSAGCRTRVAQ